MAFYAEFENENSFRSFPFAEGSVMEDTNGNALDTSMFVDAMLYPTKPNGRVRLTAIDFEAGTLEVSDDDGVIGVGSLGEVIEVVSDGRHIGTIIARNIQSTASLRREFNYLYFASACVFDFNPAGVTGIKIGNEVLTGKIVFDPSSTIVPELIQKNDEYYFDLNVISATGSTDTPSIRTIVVMRSRGSILDVEQLNTNSIEVNMGEVSRSNICANAHREDSINIYDTCLGQDNPPSPVNPVPAVANEFWVIPVGSVTDQAFNIVAPNLLADAIVNPVNVQMVQGTSQPNLPSFTRNMTEAEAEIEMKKLTSSNVIGNGIVLQVPGLT